MRLNINNNKVIEKLNNNNKHSEITKYYHEDSPRSDSETEIYMEDFF
jgi:hypothetical protein